MQIFYQIAGGNHTGTANGCHMMTYSHVEKDLSRKKHLNLNIEKKSSLTAATPKT